MDVAWINENLEAVRSTKSYFTIVDFARGPTLTTITIDTEAKLNYKDCDKVEGNPTKMIYM